MNKAIQDKINEKYQQEYYQRKGALSYSDKAYVEKLEGKLREVSIFEQFDFLKEEHFPKEADDNWGEPIDFSIEEMLDMPVMGEIQTDLTNPICIGQNESCKVVSSPNGDHTKTGDYKESDTNNFNLK